MVAGIPSSNIKGNDLNSTLMESTRVMASISVLAGKQSLTFIALGFRRARVSLLADSRARAPPI